MNEKNIVNGVNTVLSLLGITFTLENLQSLLSIILLIVNISIILCNIINNVIFKIKKAKEDGKITIDEVKDIVEETSIELKDLKENIRKEGE